MQVTCDNNFHVGFNRIYDRNLAHSLRNIYKRHERLFDGIGGEYQLDLAAKCESIRDFDDAITRVSFGWPSVDAYYAGKVLFCHLCAKSPVSYGNELKGACQNDLKRMLLLQGLHHLSPYRMSLCPCFAYRCGVMCLCSLQRQQFQCQHVEGGNQCANLHCLPCHGNTG